MRFLERNRRCLRRLSAACLLFCVVSAAATPLTYQTFSSGNASWIVSPSGIRLYLADARVLRDFSQGIAGDSLIDYCEFEGTLWISTLRGVAQLDMSTQTLEPLPAVSDPPPTGKIAVDFDYLWLCTTDRLYRFDKLSREWFSFPLPQIRNDIIAITSDGDEVVCLAATATLVFAATTEKWNRIELPRSLEWQNSVVIGGALEPVVIDGKQIHRFDNNSRTWSTDEAQQAIVDAALTDSVLYFLDGTGLYSLNRATSLIKPLSTTPGYRDCAALLKVKDTIFVAAPGNLIGYNVASSASSAIQYDPRMAPLKAQKMIFAGEIVCLTESGAFCYDSRNGTWLAVDLITQRDKSEIVWWNKEGAGVRYDSIRMTLASGSIQERYRQQASYEDSSKIMTLPWPGGLQTLANVNVHTALGKERFFDLYFDNTILNRPPNKGVYYRGAGSDRMQSARFGRNRTAVSGASVMPVAFEGIDLQLESPEKLATRDRKTLRAASGFGVRTGERRTKVLRYNVLQSYTLDSLPDTLRIKAGSLRLTIDGETVDSTAYTFASEINELQLRRKELLDPTSVIIADYEIETVSAQGQNALEIIPSANMDAIAYVSGTVSPRDWVSARFGYVGMAAGNDNHVVNVALPVELRKSIPHTMLKIEPEFGYDPVQGTGAFGGSVFSRIGDRVSFSANGITIDSGFQSTEKFDGSFGSLGQQLDITAGYDITSEVPVGYHQSARISENGTENRHVITARLRRPNLPFAEIDFSRHDLEGDIDSGSGIDSLHRIKDRARIRLFERSSSALEKLLHMKKIGYELSASEFRSKIPDESYQHGRVVYGSANVSPIQSVAIRGQGTYRVSPDSSGLTREIAPLVLVQTIGIPRGIDLETAYDVALNKFDASGKSSARVARSIGLTIKTGEWFSALGWMSPKFALLQERYLFYPFAHPSLLDVMLSESDSVEAYTFSRKFGIDIFPTAELLFRNENEFSNTHTTGLFKTFNDVTWWVNSSNLWQSRWEMITDKHSWYRHQGYSRLDRTWKPWLRSSQGIYVQYVIESSKVVKIGPHVQAGLSFPGRYIMKSFVNSHGLNVDWYYTNGTVDLNRPEITYIFSLQAILLPNISMNTAIQTTVTQSRNVQGEGRLTIIATL